MRNVYSSDLMHEEITQNTVIIIFLLLPGIPYPEEKIKLASFIRGKFADKKIDADIIIKSNEEINCYKDKTGHIVKHALAEGVSAW